jgi:hypothetical protein
MGREGVSKRISKEEILFSKMGADIFPQLKAGRL